MFVGFFALCTGLAAVALSSIISRIVKDKIPLAVAYGCIFGLDAWAISRSARFRPGEAMLMLFLGLLVVVVLAIRWLLSGSTVKELIFFVILDLLLMLGNMQAAARIYDLTSKAVLLGLVEVLPEIFFLVSVAFFIANMIWFRDHLENATAEALDEELKFYENPFSVMTMEEEENGESKEGGDDNVVIQE
ncbi:hypothetical protein IKG24_02615 [Candidatus Saccharibacteria bacterium]|nr:hypothetical protein [Candidatus Saccharibacteria bacterium]